MCVCSSKSDGPRSIEVYWCSNLALCISFGAPTKERLQASSSVQVQEKFSYLKGTKKIGAGSLFAGVLEKLLGLLLDVCQCVGP